MKLSFSLSTKPSSKQQSTLKPSNNTFKNPETDDPSSANKEYVTEFDPSKTLAQSKNPLIIPPISNEWRPQKKMKNLDLPVKSDDPNLQFELDPTSTLEIVDSNMSYGLNLRQSTKKDVGDEMKEDSLMPRSESNTIDNLMVQKLRNDLARLPEDRGLEEFDDVSVENFASALLKGYGWHEGRGIGKNHKEDVKIVEYKKRTGKEGLGFVGEAPLPPKSKETKVAPKEIEDKGQKDKGHSDDNGGNRGRYYVGKDVRIVGGSEVGLKGRIVEVIGGDSVVLKLSRSEEEITVRIRDVADLGSVEEEKCLKKLKELKIRGLSEEKGGSDKRSSKDKDMSNSRSRRESRDQGNIDKRKDSKRSREGGEQRHEPRGSAVPSWLSSHIRVRLISKEYKGGRLYLQKGEVVDVVGPTTCDISMDNSRELIQGVNQELLETALPRRGGPVLVLYGKHKGVYGSLVEKDTESETAVVRDADTHVLLNVRLEQIAEYIGDPSDIGY